MFRFQDKMDFVKSISVNDLRALIVLKNGQIIKDNSLFYEGKEYSYATNLNNKYFWQFGDKENKFLFYKDRRLKLSSFSTNTLNEKGAIVFKNKRVTDKIIADYYYHNFKDESEILIVSNYAGGPVLVYDNTTKSIFRNLNKLSSLSLLTGEYEWEVDLGAFGEISKILGVEEGFLWILMLEREEHLKKTTILCINPVNGQIAQQLKSEVVDVHLISFAEDKKSIIAINYINRASWLMELNLPDLSVKRDILIQSVHEADIYIRQYVIQDGLMYFTAVQKGGFWPQYLGVLDIATLELLWHKKVIDIEAGFNGPPQVSQDKLYALDTAGNLYIFEKETAKT